MTPKELETVSGVRNRARLLLPALVLATPGQESLEEYQALAKVLRHFVALVTWPGTSDRPLQIGVLGGSGFGTELDIAMGRTTVGGRKVQVHYLSATTFLKETTDYDVLFIDRGEDNYLPAILSKIQAKPTLTLGYGEDLARKGVMVNFLLKDNRIRFEVNASRVKDAGLVISSHLLSIAKIVES